jgi:peptide/nickel transport system substrate-binding protein
MATASLGAVAALVLAACGGSSGGGGKSGASTTFNEAISKVVRPSNAKGGTIIFDNSSTPDSTDPGNTYYANMWNFTRLYVMPLMTYASCTGKCGLQVVPDLATGPGVVSDNGLTWTYHIKPNVKFSDGATVTSADVKYAVERTFDRTVLPLGPGYFPALLGGNAATYKGPYKSKKGETLTAITTPNPTTVVFHLKAPFADFNYVAAIPQTAPVPQNKDTGTTYQLHPVSTGPYVIQSYVLNKQITLVPNKYWNPATDPTAKQLASKIIVNLNVNADDLDNRLLAGDVQMDQAGTGVQTPTRARILTNASLKAESDDPITGFMWFDYLDSQVAPLTNIHCREAVEYAANKTTLLDAYGGPYGGSIASTAMPPNIVGYKSFDLYHALSQPNGDLTDAKAQLKLCGQPNGFTIGMAYRSDRPRETAAATALQQSLSAVGIKLQLHGYPSGTYFADFAGVPNYMKAHDIGIADGGWGADWPDGYGWFYSIADGATIAPAGNYNIGALNDPKVNAWLVQMEGASSTPALRASIANDIDMEVMKQAVILPATYSKALLYRSPDLTNIFVQPYYGMFNYSELGCLHPSSSGC